MGYRPARGTRTRTNPQTPLQRGTSPIEIWYSGSSNQAAYSVANILTLDALYAYPVVIGKSGLVDRIGWEVTTPAGAGGVGRVGIYNGGVKPNHFPTSLVVDAGEFVTDSGTTKIYTPPAPIFLAAGLYWFASIFGTALPSVRGPNFLTTGWPLQGVPSTMGNNFRTNIAISQAYGALPVTFPTPSLTTNSRFAGVQVRFSS